MNVLITGANGGLGTAVCQEFLASGAKVIGVAREWKQSAPFTTLSADVTTEVGSESMVKQALEHGPIDALVHLVGGFAGGSTRHSSASCWMTTMIFSRTNARRESSRCPPNPTGSSPSSFG